MGCLHTFAIATEGSALSDFGVEAAALSLPQDSSAMPVPTAKHARRHFEKGDD
jgi:hypothetical protein